MTRTARTSGAHSAPPRDGFTDNRFLAGRRTSLGPEDIDFASIQRSPEFTLLRRRLLRFVFPMTGLFLAWYLAYVLLSSYAPDFMGQRMFGLVTVGIVFGIAQLVTTVAITLAYRSYAKRRIDPQVRLVRQQVGVDPQ